MLIYPEQVCRLLHSRTKLVTVTWIWLNSVRKRGNKVLEQTYESFHNAASLGPVPHTTGCGGILPASTLTPGLHGGTSHTHPLESKPALTGYVWQGIHPAETWSTACGGRVRGLKILLTDPQQSRTVCTRTHELCLVSMYQILVSWWPRFPWWWQGYAIIQILRCGISSSEWKQLQAGISFVVSYPV